MKKAPPPKRFHWLVRSARPGPSHVACCPDCGLTVQRWDHDKRVAHQVPECAWFEALIATAHGAQPPELRMEDGSRPAGKS